MITQAMRPEELDYSMIDPPLRPLVGSINGSPWAKTAGCCGGNACHEGGKFYLLVRVKGLEGVKKFLKWLGLSRSVGWEACIGNPDISAYALPDAEIIGLGDPWDDDWLTFDLRFRLGNGQPGREQTMGGIKALESGWEALMRGGVYEEAA
jgi:hypothetical protein